MLHIFYTFSGIFKASQNAQFFSIKYFSIFLLRRIHGKSEFILQL